ncbi:hypothetical protein C1H46_027284 [Malus baccata]|uniref:Uncharacterized protein n=1 Tax=Malus baccata TaxID=106549 RepID=A0A540LL14_MALBA|nr:hypothetical protein C1H46_027284 [Malus baccata]
MFMTLSMTVKKVQPNKYTIGGLLNDNPLGTITQSRNLIKSLDELGSPGLKPRCWFMFKFGKPNEY